MCLNKANGCNARGEMFKDSGEWLFVLHDNPHNHVPNGD